VAVFAFVITFYPSGQPPAGGFSLRLPVGFLPSSLPTQANFDRQGGLMTVHAQ